MKFVNTAQFHNLPMGGGSYYSDYTYCIKFNISIFSIKIALIS